MYLVVAESSLVTEIPAKLKNAIDITVPKISNILPKIYNYFRICQLHCHKSKAQTMAYNVFSRWWS